ncbi:hypothetical protein T07_7625 [Trichinella nelsoni]|uniref:Uncharacterized protein n=1 Tax=Trichinella nelsoni TaxID=6336 RepID=A0A0V0RFJ6_9BILA|nr:hypothetical protein T07_7625 [Trichinella nelsoni]
MESGRKIAESFRLGLSTISDIRRDIGKNSCEELSFQKLTEAIWCHNLSRDEDEQWLADHDTPLFETLTDDGILEAVVADGDRANN